MESQEKKIHHIILHIGLMKTASTLMQHNVFPRFPGLIYIDSNRSLFGRKMIKCDKTVFISNEAASGCPYLKEIDGLNYLGQFERSLDNIKTVFNKPKLIICFREPSSLIQSIYKQYLHEGGALTWDQFFNLNGDGLVKKEEFFFSNFLTALKKRFSSDDLFVYTFDDFKNNTEKVVSDIYNFSTGEVLPDNVTFDTTKRSNSSVKDDLEGLLIYLNKLNKTCIEKFGFRLQIKLFGKTLNPRVFCQYLMPKIFDFKNNRDLSQVRSYYATDWKHVNEEIKSDKRKY